MSQVAHLLRGYDFKDCSSGFLLIIPGQRQSDILINLWPNCKLVFMLILFVLLRKTWNVAKPGVRLAGPPNVSTISRFLPHLISGAVSLALTAGSHLVAFSQGSVQAG